jgi:hypothetical protein
MRQTDRSFAWFDSVAERHQEHSMEVIQMRRLFSESGQIYLPFVDPETGSMEEAPMRTTGNLLKVSVHGATAKPMTSSQLIETIEGEFQ